MRMEHSLYICKSESCSVLWLVSDWGRCGGKWSGVMDVALECKLVGEEMVIALIVSLCFRSSLVLESRLVCLLIGWFWLRMDGWDGGGRKRGKIWNGWSR